MTIVAEQIGRTTTRLLSLLLQSLLVLSISCSGILGCFAASAAPLLGEHAEAVFQNCVALVEPGALHCLPKTLETGVRYPIGAHSTVLGFPVTDRRSLYPDDSSSAKASPEVFALSTVGGSLIRKPNPMITAYDRTRTPTTLIAAVFIATKPGAGAAGSAVDEASLAANTSAKVRGHVFVDKNNLQPLVSKFGSEEAVIKEMLSSVQGSVPKTGFFEVPVQIGGQTVVVRGAVVNGVTRISTAFTP